MLKNTSRRMAGAHDGVSEVVKHIQKELLPTSKVEWIPQLFANVIKGFLVKNCGLRMDESPKLPVLADNSQFKACLEAIVALGRSAESDLQNIQEDSKTMFGISGQELSCSALTDVLDQNLVGQAVREKNDNLDLSKETPWEDFEKAQDVVLQLLLANLNASKISSMKNHISEMMDCFRHHQAWRLAKLAPEKNYDEAFKGLHSIFKKSFTAIRRDNSKNPDELINLEKEILECAWIWEKQPPLSIKEGDMDLQIRILGVDFQELKSCKIYAFRESDCTKGLPPESCIELEVSNLKVEPTSGGIIVSGKVKLTSSNLNKRGSCLLFEKFWRIVWQIEESWRSIKCLSAPFTVRTGAPQLWPHTGAVVWYIWSVKDLYKTPFVCPKEMKFNSALSMLQALVSVACPKLEFSQDEKETLLKTLKSLNRKPGTPQDKLSMAGFVHDGMPVQGIRAALEGTEKKPAQFSCFCWFSGTVNSLKLLQDYHACSRISYLGFCQCEKILNEKEKGSCILRFSQNLVVNYQSMNPNVPMMVQIQGLDGMHSVKLKVKSLEEKSLYTTLKSINLPKGINIILPETVTAPHREGKLVECYKSRYREGPPQRDIVDVSKEFERMDFSDFSSSASCSNEPPRTLDNVWANSAAPFDSPDWEGNPEPPSKAPKLSSEMQANGENMEDLDDIDCDDLVPEQQPAIDPLIYEPVPADEASLNDLLNKTMGPR